MVLHFQRNLQRGEILVPRTIQGIGLCVQSYSLRGSADHRLNWTLLRKELLRRTGESFDSAQRCYDIQGRMEKRDAQSFTGGYREAAKMS